MTTRAPKPWPRQGIHKFTLADGATGWAVPSRSLAHGAYRVVLAGRDGAHGPMGMKCTCPRGRVLTHDWELWMGTPDQPQTCHHVRDVLAAEADDGAEPRPQAAVHKGLVDD